MNCNDTYDQNDTAEISHKNNEERGYRKFNTHKKF